VNWHPDCALCIVTNPKGIPPAPAAALIGGTALCEHHVRAVEHVSEFSYLVHAAATDSLRQ
jgi:hypothetical protein